MLSNFKLHEIKKFKDFAKLALFDRMDRITSTNKQNEQKNILLQMLIIQVKIKVHNQPKDVSSELFKQMKSKIHFNDDLILFILT